MARPEHIIRLADLKLIRDSAELEAEIAGTVPGYFVTIYRRFRGMAAESVAALAYIDPQDEKAIATLQRDILVYDRFVEITRAIIQEGLTADQQTTDQERQEMLDILLSHGEDGERQAIELGLIDGAPQDA